MTTQLDAVLHLDIPTSAWFRDASQSAGNTVALYPDSAPSGEQEQAQGASILRIRSYSLADIPPLIRLPGTLRLDVPDSLVRRAEMIDLPAALPILRKDRPTFVATADDHPVGYIRFSPRGPDGRWVASAVAASTGVFSPEPVWEALLTHSVRAAGLRGVRRLYARVPVGHPLVATMHESGWVSYTRETVFRAERPNAQARSGRAPRLQEPADTWAIHQLYAASVPRQIQEVEAFTSQVWHMEHQNRSRRGIRETGWLLEEGPAVVGYGRYTRGPRADMIDIVVAPGDRDRLGSLLDVTTMNRARSQPVYCALRAYHLDMRDELSSRGFVDIGEQELLIRYTTATVRAPVADPVLFPVELRPALPRRVPTFLEGQPTDGSI